MKTLYLILVSLITTATSFAANGAIDSLKQTRSAFIEDRVAVLKNQVDSTQNDSVRALIYSEIAAQYLSYDSTANKKTVFKYQNEALDYTYKALHLFSRYDDTVGQRNSFDNLAAIYYSKKIYPQAKWFILQSNSLSRSMNDVPNIMKSLVKLAALKIDIKDYSLAMRDLNEALTLSVTNHDPRMESEVQLGYALLYNRMKNPAKRKIALERHKFIDDSLHRAEVALAAKYAAAAEVKKKAFIKTDRKAYRTPPTGKIASL